MSVGKKTEPEAGRPAFDGGFDAPELELPELELPELELPESKKGNFGMGIFGMDTMKPLPLSCYFQLPILTESHL